MFLSLSDKVMTNAGFSITLSDSVVFLFKVNFYRIVIFNSWILWSLPLCGAGYGEEGITYGNSFGLSVIEKQLILCSDGSTSR